MAALQPLQARPLNPGTQAIGVPELDRRVQVLGARVARVEAEYRQHQESQGRARSRSRVRRQSVEERLLVLEASATGGASQPADKEEIAARAAASTTGGAAQPAVTEAAPLNPGTQAIDVPELDRRV